MNSIDKELAILADSIAAAQKHREECRRNYVDKDREIGSDIKAMLARVKELQTFKMEKEALDSQIQKTSESQSPIDLARQETAATMFDVQKLFTKHDKHSHVGTLDKRRRVRYDYEKDVVPAVIEILKDSGEALKASLIMRILKNEYEMEFSNTTLAMQKILKESKDRIIRDENGKYALNKK